MSRRSGPVSPVSFERARRQFERWRRRRVTGRLIPEDLWRVAVGLARDHGVSKTARALGLDYYALKRHLEAASQQRGESPSSDGARFLEVPFSLAPPAPGCVVELEDRGRARLRIELRGPGISQIEAVARTLWRERR